MSDGASGNSQTVLQFTADDVSYTFNLERQHSAISDNVKVTLATGTGEEIVEVPSLDSFLVSFRGWDEVNKASIVLSTANSSADDQSGTGFDGTRTAFKT